MTKYLLDHDRRGCGALSAENLGDGYFMGPLGAFVSERPEIVEVETQSVDWAEKFSAAVWGLVSPLSRTPLGRFEQEQRNQRHLDLWGKPSRIKADLLEEVSPFDVFETREEAEAALEKYMRINKTVDSLTEAEAEAALSHPLVTVEIQRSGGKDDCLNDLPLLSVVLADRHHEDRLDDHDKAMWEQHCTFLANRARKQLAE